MRELDCNQEPSVEQMYSNSENVLPSWNPKTRVTTGKYVDWGTKLYHLELELSYKNNEIEILKKKLKKCTDELFPDGDCGKKSNVVELRKKVQATQRQLADRSQDLSVEKQRNEKLSRELAKVKKRCDSLRRRRTNSKSVQTLPDNEKGVQVSTRNAPKTRTIMTQCSPAPYRPPTVPKRPVVHTHVKTDIKTDSNGDEHIREANAGNSEPARNNARSPEKVKFASAVSIKDNSKPEDYDEPLEMSLLQEFSETGVKTVIQSNKNFKMSETPARMSSETFEAIKAGTKPLDSIQAAHEEVDKKDPEHSPLDADSGIFSVRNSCDSPANTMNYYVREQQNIKPSYTQILQGSYPRHLQSPVERPYEKNLPYYLNGAAGQPVSSDRVSPSRSYPGLGNVELYAAANARKAAQNEPATMIPYYLFRRENNGSNRMRRSEKPIYVHTSEINFR